MNKPDLRKIRNNFIQWFKDVKQIIKENRKIAVAILGFVAVVAIAIVVSSSIAKRKQTVEVVLPETETIVEEGYVVAEEPLEIDAYPEINSLIKRYYNAVASGDIELVEQLKSGVDDKERIVIQKKSDYIEDFPVVTCYTKRGPVADSYLVYAYYEVKLYGYDVTAPGLNAWYVVKNESGNYYINDDEQDEKLADYCKIISVQDDVVDLNNTTNVKFNEILDNNAEFASFMAELPSQLTLAVGEELAKLNADEEPVEQVEETIEVAPADRTAVANTVVNVRTSDSGNADKVGVARVGDQFPLIEEKLNGWSKIEFDGKEAYIKSEFLDILGEEKEEEESDESSEENKSDNSATATASSPSSGKAKASTTVKIRKDSSTDSEQIGLVYGGEKVEVIEKLSNGWSKIKFGGKTGYIKSEYLE